MIFLKKSVAGCEKKAFDHLMAVAAKLPPTAKPELIRAIVRPIQSDLLLAVGEEGQDARPEITPSSFFFEKLLDVQSYEMMKKHERDNTEFSLSLASDMVMPCPWSLTRYIDNLGHIGARQGNPWKQDKINHYIDLWLPWKIGFVRGGNHSIAAGIIAGEGQVTPEHVYDMSYLFELVRTDGLFWYINGQKSEKVKSGRTAAVFEIGRLLER